MQPSPLDGDAELELVPMISLLSVISRCLLPSLWWADPLQLGCSVALWYTFTEHLLSASSCKGSGLGGGGIYE